MTWIVPRAPLSDAWTRAFDSGTYLANILFEGDKSEHEEEAGKIVLHEGNAFNKDIQISEVFDIPFRELWMRKGCQLFDPLAQIEGK